VGSRDRTGIRRGIRIWTAHASRPPPVLLPTAGLRRSHSPNPQHERHPTTSPRDPAKWPKSRYDDDDLFRFVTNIYAVLLTRGIRGTYVYATDPALRAYLRRYF
jgi:hypothetical protein